MAKLRGKLSASTLLEVIVAMVVILIVFVLATGIYANVIRTSPSVKDQRVQSQATGLIQQSIVDDNWNNEEVVIDSVFYQKTVVQYQNIADLRLMQVVAVEQGKEIGTVRRIIKMRKDNAK